MGTSKQKPNHMLQNAVNTRMTEFPEIIKTEMKNA